MMASTGMAGLARTTLVAMIAIIALVTSAVVWMLQTAPPAAPRGPGAGAAETFESGAEAARSSTRAITAKAFSESEPAEGAASSRTGALEIEVIGPTGRPAAKSWLVLRRDDEALGAAETDAEGVGRLKAGEGDADLIVLPRGAPALARKIPIAPGKIRIELPAGVSISGRVEVNGDVPREPVGLRISGPDDPVVDGIVWGALLGEPVFSCVTSSSGAFEIGGLRTGSEWRLEAPATGYVLDEVRCDGNLISAVTAPASTVVVKLSRFPVVRLRAVSGPERAPVSGATCEVVLKRPGGVIGIGTHSAGSDGRVEFACANTWNRTRATRVDLVLRSPDAVRQKPVVLDPAPEDDRDLGDVELPTVRTLAVVVRDPGGAPIEGAFLHVAEGQPDPRSRTDAQGRTTVLVPSDGTVLRAGALKYEITEAPVPRDCTEPFVVVLRPTGGIEVRLRVPPGTPADVVLVRISAETGELFTGKVWGGSDPIAIAAGATEDHGGGWGDDGSEFSYAPDANGRVVIAGVKPGVAVTLAAIDLAEHMVLASSVVTLEPAEWRTVDLEVIKTARSVRGRVRDQNRRPLERAAVSIRQAFLTETDAEGRFVLNGLFESGAFSATKPGFVPYVRGDFVLPPEGEELDIRLQPACKLTVKVVDTRGAPVRGVGVMVVTDGLNAQGAAEKSPGVHECDSLPPDVDVTITAQWAQRQWSRSARTKAESVEVITLPVPGGLRVDYSAIDGEEFVLVLETMDEPPKRSAFYFRAGAGPPREYEATPVLAGEYRAELHHSQKGRALAAAPQTLTVKAGETTRIVFQKP